MKFGARHLPLALVLLVSALVTLTTLVVPGHPSSLGPGDYPNDARPAIEALAHLNLSAFFASDYVMGPFSLLLRAPFAALAGGDTLGAYRLGAFPCVLAAGALGLYLSRLARRQGRGPVLAAAITGLCLCNPLTFEALWAGHPEEILTAALAIGAVAAASQGQSARAAVLLGLALASKQWAVIAVLPTLMALPSRRLPVALGAVGVSAVLIVPTVIAAPHVFAAAQQNVAFGHRFVDAWSAWFPFAGAKPGWLVSTPHGVTVTPFEGGSMLIGRYAHPLIVLSAFVVPLVIAAQRRRFRLDGGDAMLLLGLLALLRCALDPADNAYYHLPVLLALAGCDAFRARRLPLGAMAAATIALGLISWEGHMDPRAFNALYLLFAVPGMVAIAWSLCRPAPAWVNRPLTLRLPRLKSAAATS